jgi:hypothetical protein
MFGYRDDHIHLFPPDIMTAHPVVRRATSAAKKARLVLVHPCDSRITGQPIAIVIMRTLASRVLATPVWSGGIKLRNLTEG